MIYLGEIKDEQDLFEKICLIEGQSPRDPSSLEVEKAAKIIMANYFKPKKPGRKGDYIMTEEQFMNNIKNQ